MIKHIEFLGLPASGKTTLTGALGRALTTPGQCVTLPSFGAPATVGEKWRKQVWDLIVTLGFMIANPLWSCRMWRACSAFRQPSTHMQVRMFLSCLRLEQAARRNRRGGAGNKFVIVDQGVYQAIWSLALCAPAETLDNLSSAAAPILRLFKSPDLVVLVDTPGDVVRDRLSTDANGHGRLPLLIERDPLWLSKAEHCLQAVWRLALNAPAPRTFKFVPADRELDDLVDLVAEEN